MRSLTMTTDETARYDADDTSMLADLRSLAQTLADETGETVEIRTADGIVVEAVSP